jgi:hypothetical protein
MQQQLVWDAILEEYKRLVYKSILNQDRWHF